MSPESLTQRFSTYFEREVAQKAAASLSNGSEIEFQIFADDGQTVAETFTFTRAGGRNQVREGAPKDPQILFTLTPLAAQAILDDPANDIGAIGVNIAKLILSPDATRRVTIRFKAGFFTLFNKGYFGVVTAGGAQFASYLASKGFNGMSAIKAALKGKS